MDGTVWVSIELLILSTRMRPVLTDWGWKVTDYLEYCHLSKKSSGYFCWYCWWKKSCTTWDVKFPINDGIKYQPQLVSRIFSINSTVWVQPQNSQNLSHGFLSWSEGFVVFSLGDSKACYSFLWQRRCSLNSGVVFGEIPCTDAGCCHLCKSKVLTVSSSEPPIGRQTKWWFPDCWLATTKFICVFEVTVKLYKHRRT